MTEADDIRRALTIAPTNGVIDALRKTISANQQQIDAAKQRDEFAKSAMQSLLIASPGAAFEHIAEDAYKMADAMMKARKESTGGA